MPNMIVSGGPNAAQPTGEANKFSMDLNASIEGYATGFGFTVILDTTGANPVPGMRAAIKAAAIAEAANLGFTVSGSDKVVSLVDPVIN